MTPEEAKNYANQRFNELTESNPTWTRCGKVNLIIQELWNDHNFRLTTPTGNTIVAVNEDLLGLVFEVNDLNIRF